MKITVLAYGSRGDVQPPLGLAHRLHARGHDVTLAVPTDCLALAERMGCRVASLGAEARSVLDRGDLVDSLRRGRTMAFFREALELERASHGARFDALRAACEGAELLLVPPLLDDVSVSIAELGGQRIAYMLAMPVWSNSLYPSFFISSRSLPGWANRMTHALLELGTGQLRELVNESRAQLGLPASRARPSLRFRKADPPVLYWVPELVMPRPPELGDNHHFTGYWGAPRAVREAYGERAPPAELVEFLAAGPPPLYFGLGSMPIVDEELVERVRRAAEVQGLRLVVGRGWSRHASGRGAGLLVVDDVDHEWLFPRCAAVVHHGGASTTGAALRAGVPAIVASVFVDQPVWGRRVEALGCGAHLPFRAMTKERLARTLERVLSPPIRARAEEIGATLRAMPDGIEVSADLIDRRGAHFPTPRA